MVSLPSLTDDFLHIGSMDSADDTTIDEVCEELGLDPDVVFGDCVGDLVWTHFEDRTIVRFCERLGEGMYHAFVVVRWLNGATFYRRYRIKTEEVIRHE